MLHNCFVHLTFQLLPKQTKFHMFAFKKMRGNTIYTLLHVKFARLKLSAKSVFFLAQLIAKTLVLRLISHIPVPARRKDKKRTAARSRTLAARRSLTSLYVKLTSSCRI